MSTASRSCPTCAGPLDTTGKCRACAIPDAAPPSELVTKAEALFSSYLAARIVRARRAVKAAKMDLLRDPRSREKVSAVQAAEAEAQRLQGQLVVHTRSRQEAGQAAPSVDAAVEAADQAAVAPPTVPAASPHTDRHCPRCNNRLPGSVNRCRCGYTFETAETALPSFLTAAELATLGTNGKRR